jgi:uncharacterized protein YjbJ (UPF0337 family)
MQNFRPGSPYFSHTFHCTLAHRIFIHISSSLFRLRGLPADQVKGKIMNKNQVKGVVKEIAGKVQEEAGKLVGNNEQQAKGLSKQIIGQAEKVYGDAKEAVKNATRV